MPAIEARSMIAGAVAFFVYACFVSWMMNGRFHALLVTVSGVPLRLAWHSGSGISGSIEMSIHLDSTALRETKWYEYAARFLFGGLITAIAGIIASYFGPAIGGLFLAFPAIFPASATLIEKQETEKARRGHASTDPKQAVAVEAKGSALGSIGLITFAVFVFEFLARYRSWLVLTMGILIWLAVALLLWKLLENSENHRGR